MNIIENICKIRSSNKRKSELLTDPILGHIPRGHLDVTPNQPMKWLINVSEEDIALIAESYRATIIVGETEHQRLNVRVI